MLEEFKKFTLFQKSFFIIVAAGLIFYLLYHTGVVKLPAARAQDCTGVSIPENSTVIKMEHGKFDPSELTVHVCDTVLFLNLDDEQKWPAVGPHPTHSSYPGFDAGREMKKFDYFQFQLNRTGSYSFHDHLHESVRGKINIIEK
jgi:plastocyanin